ncbi:MAG: GNAT family N-acetyltransferase [Chloroflexi bacterium]|nr:GNAT family N-acetyltransferase [Chloroflexota bacterium]
MMIEQIKEISDQRLEGSARMLARSFQDDPIFQHAMPDKTFRQNCLPDLFMLNLKYGARFGELFFIPHQGLAIWLPPGKSTITVIRALQAGMWLTPFKIGLSAVSRLARLNTVSEKFHEQIAPDPHWYLFILGVDPLCQGRGLGGALLQPGLARADDDHLPCYLETNNPLAVGFYQKHGFGLIATHQTSHSGLCLWSMRRESR